MDWRKLLCGVTATAVLVLGPALRSSADSADPGCQPADAIIGTCTATATPDDVQLELIVDVPAAPGFPWQPISHDGFFDAVTGVEDAVPCLPAPNDRCQGFGPPRQVPGAPVVDPAQPIRLSDIASFRPTAGVASMEPNGWMVVGLDTNFFGSTQSQVVTGTLLGAPAAVRFTPVGWRWSYGDGTSAVLGSAGDSWASQGIAEFEATSGSHVYSAAGAYVIDLTIEYAAEYSFGAGSWNAINGTLAVQANQLVATAGGATTVLVERECTANPRGPGC